MQGQYRSISLLVLFVLLSSLALTIHGEPTQNSLERDLQAAAELFEAESFREAQQVLENSLAANKTADKETVSAASQLLGMCYEQQGDRKRAEQIYNSVIQQYPGTQGAVRAQFRLDTMAGKQTNLRGTAMTPEEMERAFNSENDAKKAAKLASAIIWQHGNRESIDTARKVYGQFVARFGFIEEAQEVMFALAGAYENAGMFPEALDMTNQLFKKFPTAESNLRYLIQYGYYLNLTESSEAALGVFDRALAGNPDKLLRTKALLGKGIAYRNLRKPREASEALAAAKTLAEEIGDKGHLELIEHVIKEVKSISDEDHPKAKKQPVWIMILSLGIVALVGIVVIVRVLRLRRSAIC